MGNEETLLAIHTSVARTEAVVESISERVAEMRHSLDQVRHTVQTGQIEDVKRDDRIAKLEAAHAERKTHRFELVKWVGGIIAAVAVTLLVTLLGLKKP